MQVSGQLAKLSSPPLRLFQSCAVAVAASAAGRSSPAVSAVAGARAPQTDTQRGELGDALAAPGVAPAAPASAAVAGGEPAGSAHVVIGDHSSAVAGAPRGGPDVSTATRHVSPLGALLGAAHGAAHAASHAATGSSS